MKANRYDLLTPPLMAPPSRPLDWADEEAATLLMAAPSELAAALRKARSVGQAEALEEAASGYHEAIALTFESEARSSEFPGIAEDHRKVAKNHRQYAKDIRQRVWRDPPSESIKGNAGQGVKPSAKECNDAG